ncbi:MAG TPA: cation-translocating P-type ATPase [Clostridiaceae bacterium]|nr:cation-translocating P-type ATPase [Clostridiaceae bacterium]
MDKIIDKNKKIDIGLTKEEVEERIKENKVNYDTSLPTKSIKTIVRENIFTLFNLINILLGVAVFCVGSYKNLLFLIVIFCNTAISIIQEINSKKAVDKLSILAQAKVNCIRDGEKQEIGINSIVLDDLLMLETGNQIVADSIILEGEVEVNESFITGESDVIYKRKGDTLLSGSFVVSGKCKAEVIHIGDENYTSKISSGAKYVKKVNSEIMKSLNGIIKIVSIAIVPIGILLFFNQLGLTENSFKNAVVNTVAAIIGMIPEGLVLLTSTVLAVSVIRLSKRKVLVQELYCIETLARVDTLCLDKTGTITEGTMEVNDIIEITKSKEELEEILSEISSASDDNNSTIEAIRAKYKNKQKWKVINKIPFSSQKKWSGVCFKDKGSYIIGAPEFVLREKYDEYKERIEKYSNDYRVIIVANSEGDFIEKELPDKLEVLGFVLISDVIRKEASKTLEYFKEQGVNIKIISGDNPITVSKIAKRAGVENSEKYINMQEIKTKEQLEKAAKEYTIFGRVTPVQKKELVQALKKEGHTVAMTGDGVNDVLALKEADCSIAMASGSDATRNVAELVLLDSNFASMPEIVLEGRRTINNIERSATLFLVKTIYASILAIIFLFVNMPYPFMPIQLTLISTVTIGIPSFVLALEPNKERIKGKFLRNVISRALRNSFNSCN